MSEIKITTKRCVNNPLITFASDASMGENINGPSVIKVPSWIANPLGKYYMYFAHHAGDYIRLAYADNIAGPWTVYQSGTLQLKNTPQFAGHHIASPDVHINDKNREIIMYVHGYSTQLKGQFTCLAFSKDALVFKPANTVLGKCYFRVFNYQDYFYAIAMADGGRLYRSEDGKTPFVEGKQVIQKMRHAAVQLIENSLLVYYSRKGDCPERILLSTVDLNKDWRDWVASDPIEVIRPEKDYEGIEYELKPSEGGKGIELQQLRDPCIFEENGKTYLFYSCAGEMAIAMAELNGINS